MRTVTVEEVEPRELGKGSSCRRLSDPLGTTDLAINRYRVGPGDRLWGLHAHADQEEVYLVLEGEATLETERGTVPLEAGETARFAPGEFHGVKNGGESGVTLLALGAPRETGDLRVPIPCQGCGHQCTGPTVTEDGDAALRCPDCGTDSAVECPECGSDEKRAVLAEDGETVLDTCLDCGHGAAVSRF
ncbi:cupin domain-containing protein [Natronorarus salvus]|uniref:cupin domain-containing protein n=1 Tax=Natronorarus salvus TaxID=3117733 RepID=UPI002F26509E